MPAKESNERLFLDLSKIKAKMNMNLNVTKPNWQIMVDERTQMKWSYFYETKKGMVEPTCVLFQKWKQAGMPVKYLRMDNAGENKSLEEKMNSVDWKLNIDAEYTAVYTPKQNHLAELSFYIIANRGRAMMYRANVPLMMRYKLFKEAFTTVTQLDQLAVIEINRKSKKRYKHWSSSDRDPKFAKSLRTRGEAGTVKTRKVTTSKLEDRGTTCMLVGYALNHDHGVYRMWNPNTDRLVVTRDVIWLRRMYFENKGGADNLTIGPTFTNEVWEGDSNESSIDEAVESEDEDDDENESVDTISDIEPDEDIEEPRADVTTGTEPEVRQTTTRSGCVVKPPPRLIEEISNITNAERNYLTQIIAMQEERYSPQNEFQLMVLVKDEEEYELVGMGSKFKNTKEVKVMRYNEAMASENS